MTSKPKAIVGMPSTKKSHCQAAKGVVCFRFFATPYAMRPLMNPAIGVETYMRPSRISNYVSR